MFRTSYVHLQEDNIVHAPLYGMFYAEITIKGNIVTPERKTYHIPVLYGMFCA